MKLHLLSLQEVFHEKYTDPEDQLRVIFEKLINREPMNDGMFIDTSELLKSVEGLDADWFSPSDVDGATEAWLIHKTEPRKYGKGISSILQAMVISNTLYFKPRVLKEFKRIVKIYGLSDKLAQKTPAYEITTPFARDPNNFSAIRTFLDSQLPLHMRSRFVLRTDL